mmetsp:Transcript_79182/g.232466  ORF Transcript_79182/g.232466 Transcript_79182/m.232466 type:complete len:226 (-) Transcript_79182:630-1307(-)
MCQTCTDILGDARARGEGLHDARAGEDALARVHGRVVGLLAQVHVGPRAVVLRLPVEVRGVLEALGDAPAELLADCVPQRLEGSLPPIQILRRGLKNGHSTPKVIGHKGTRTEGELLTPLEHRDSQVPRRHGRREEAPGLLLAIALGAELPLDVVPAIAIGPELHIEVRATGGAAPLTLRHDADDHHVTSQIQLHPLACRIVLGAPGLSRVEHGLSCSSARSCAS